MDKTNNSNYLASKDFFHRFTLLIALAWTVPAIVGLTFILFIGVLNSEQLIGILLTPTEPAFIIGWLVFAIWYFRKYTLPITELLSSPANKTPEKQTAALDCMKGFPFRFWGLFLCYLVLAPASVILSAEYFTDYVAQPVDWFRINLIALIVSIIVGLPIFFLVLDLFGKSLQGIKIFYPHVTIKVKVFLIGALVPLLIDTMLVQYFWTRTGFFTMETFFVWLFLEVLAIAGSLIFTHSFGQSLTPLQEIVNFHNTDNPIPTTKLQPRSTDELGVLTSNYQELLEDLYVYREKLEDLVEQRTEELETANKELEAFNSSIAHDLRTPINMISSYCQLVYAECADTIGEECKDYLKRINTTAVEMTEVIENLLQLARITQKQIEKEEINLSLMVSELMQKYSSLNAGRTVEIDIEENLECMADRGAMIIMMDNLLNNAWKYTQNKAKAKIRIGQRKSENGICIYVEDNGAGFDGKNADGLFEVFQRLHTDDDFSGTGVGLATVSRIVEKHGGRIWAESEVNKGATFYINLPE